MNRRDIFGALFGTTMAFGTRAVAYAGLESASSPIRRPNGPIRVTFAMSYMQNVIDLAGPWETFQDTVDAGGNAAFELSTVAETAATIEATAGLRIKPQYTFANLPFTPNVLVVGASKSTPAYIEFIKAQHGKVDVTMSVCTGAFKLAQAGILDGKRATTHHEFYDRFEQLYPKVTLVRGPRFVDNGNIVTAGGLTSGIATALHVVSRYFDQATTAQTALRLEFVPSNRPTQAVAASINAF